MRLIDTRALVKDGSAKLVEFIDERSMPLYAILSHTWGRPDEEVLFEDVLSSSNVAPSFSKPHEVASFYHPSEIARRGAKSAWYKIYEAARKAHEDGYQYLWIDTCW